MSENIKQLEEFIESTKHLPAQKTTEWVNNRCNTVGASEIKDIFPTKKGEYNSMANLVANKIGNKSKFQGNVSTRFGNLFENVSRMFAHHITQCKTPIYETGSLPGPLERQSYSPDGIGVVDITFEDDKYECVVLFEFKCPPKTEPNGSVPPQYAHQLQAGLTTVEFASYMIFINNSYRKCAFNNLDFTPKYDKNFHNDSRFKIPLKETYAFGIIGLYVKEESNLEYRDYGPSHEFEFNNILELVEQGHVSVWYSNISYNDNLINIDYVEAHQPDLLSNKYHRDELMDDFNTFCASSNYKKIGIIPWKLCRADVLLIDYDPKWEVAAQKHLKNFWKIVDHIKASDNPALEYYNLYPDKNITIEITDSTYDSDSDA